MPATSMFVRSKVGLLLFGFPASGFGPLPVQSQFLFGPLSVPTTCPVDLIGG